QPRAAGLFVRTGTSQSFSIQLSGFCMLATCTVRSLCALALFFAAPAAAESLHGTVRDGAGHAVVNAHVSAGRGAENESAITDSNGEFALPDLGPTVMITIEAPGFAPRTQEWRGGALDIALQPASVRQEIVVSATRTAVSTSEVAASVSRLDADVMQ